MRAAAIGQKEFEPGNPVRGSEPLLDLRDLEVTFQSPGQVPVKALKGISFQIGQGESLGIVGESGSGKSTLAHSILRLLPRDIARVRGEIHFDGLNLVSASERALQRIRGARIAMIFQQPAMALHPLMRVSRQVTEVIHAHRPWRWRRCANEAMRVLERLFGTDCRRVSQAYPHQLSGGEKQRVAIAQAVACEPQLVIADEPTASLDAVWQADILGVFREMRSARSVSLLFITHNPAILPELADRILVLRGGELVEQGRFEELCRRPRAAYTAELLSSLTAL